MIVPYKDVWPDIDETVFVADFAVISGDVTIGADSSVWFSTMIRGDVAPTRIGKRVSIQDLSCLHQSPNNPLVIEDDVTIGHKVTLHSCTIKKGALVGMGSIILDGAVVEEGAFVGAGSLVPPGKVIPAGMLALGSPAKVVRALTDEDRADMERIVENYVEKGKHYKNHQN